MALSDAEKQARYRERRKAELADLRESQSKISARLRTENAALRAEISHLRKVLHGVFVQLKAIFEP